MKTCDSLTDLPLGWYGKNPGRSLDPLLNLKRLSPELAWRTRMYHVSGQEKLDIRLVWLRFLDIPSTSGYLTYCGT